MERRNPVLQKMSPASIHSYCLREAFLPLSWFALGLVDEAALSCAAEVIKAPLGYRGA